MALIADIASNRILSVKISGQRGSVKKWFVTLDNLDKSFDNLFLVGDTVSIYLGYIEPSLTLKGNCLKINDGEEGTITLEGYDYSDYMCGPLVDREYYEKDWGAILRDLIRTYTILDESLIENVGTSCTGRQVYYFVPLWTVILDILDEIDYDIEVTTDKKVRIYSREAEPTYAVRDMDIISLSQTRDSSKLVNRIIVRGEYERLIDNFDYPTIRTTNWSVKSGTWAIDNWTLKHSGALEGVIFSEMSGYNLDITSIVRQKDTWTGLSIYFRRKIDSSFVDGYEVRFTDSAIELYRGGTEIAIDSQAYSFSPDVDYTIKIVCDDSRIYVYVDNKVQINIEESVWTAGKMALKAPADKETYFDSIRMETNTPIIAMAEDLVLQAKYGLKEDAINRPELNTNEEATRWATFELSKSRFQTRQLKMILEGTLSVKEGDVLRFYVQTPKIFSEDYLVIGVTHNWEGGMWDTSLVLAELVPELEAILRGLRMEVSRRTVGIAVPISKSYSDVLPVPSDAKGLIYTERENMLGLTDADMAAGLSSSQIGFNLKVIE